MNRVSLIIGGLLVAFAGRAFAEEKVDFEKQIYPIFSSICYKCHTSEKHKGGLRLDSVAGIRKGGKAAGSKVLVPGDPENSDMYHRITLPKDDDDVMPPENKGEHLTKAQTDLIKAWIQQGADFGKWKGK